MSKVQVDTIDTRSGTSTMQIGSTNTSTINIGVSGDTVNIPSGVTIANAGTATGFGGTNTPYFVARRNSAQTLSNNAYAKVQFDVEVLDSASAFDPSSNYRFTIPSGQAGKYYFGAGVQFGDNTTQQYHYVDLRKNNSVFSSQPTGITTTSNDTNRYYQTIEALVDLSVGDYVEVFALAKFTSGTGTMNYSYFIGYKLVE